MKLIKTSLILILVLSLFSAFLGCAKRHVKDVIMPEQLEKLKTTKTALLFPVDIKVYKLDASNELIEIYDLSETGKENIKKAIMDGFKKRGIEIKELKIDKEDILMDEDLRALYRNVQYIKYVKKAKNATMDSKYPIEVILKKYGSDVLVIVYGSDAIPTREKIAGDITKDLGKITVMLGLAAAGIFIVPPPTEELPVASINISIIEPAGKTIWHKTESAKKGRTTDYYGFRDPEKASEFINKALSDFPTGN